MQRTDKEWIEHYLRKIDFVKWDRFVFNPKDGIVQVYGWIDRKDLYKDFAYIEFILANHKVLPVITSSKKYSKKLVEMLMGENEPHYNCQRIEDNFTVKNSIKLKSTAFDKTEISEVSTD